MIYPYYIFWLLLINGLINLLVGLIVLMRNHNKLTNILFFTTSILVNVWLLSIAEYYIVQPSLIFNWIELYYIDPLFLLANVILLTDLFPNRNSLNIRKCLILLFLVTIGSLPIVINHHFLIKQIIYLHANHIIILNNTGYIYYSFFIITFFLLILKSIYRLNKDDKQYNHVQVRIYSFGVITSAFLGLLFNLILPFYGNYQLIWIGPSMTSIYLISNAYLVIRYKLFDIRLIIVKALAYFLSLIMLSTVYGFLVFGIAKFLLGINIPVVVQAVISGGTAIVGLSFHRVKLFFDKLTNRFFYQDAYDPQDLFDDLNHVLVTIYRLDLLLERVSEIIAIYLKVDYVLIGIKNSSYNKQRMVATNKINFDQKDILTIMLLSSKTNQAILHFDDMDNNCNELSKLMNKYKVSILARLSSNINDDQEGGGYLMLGNKKSGSLYNKNDLRVISVITNDLNLALQNSLHYEEIKNFNATLQQKVDQATRQLRKTNDQLKHMDETKDEFISMASHQLRTPLTSIKGYISMVIEEDAGPITTTQKEMLGQAFFSAQRMVFLITDLLNVSRLKSGKFMIETGPVNLSELVKQEISQLKETATSRSITISFDEVRDFPYLMIDETKIRQVIMNLIDNAIYYTPIGGNITILLLNKQSTIEMRISDNGIGVPRSEQLHLFTKFYRATNARKTRPDGTGLGLYMAKKIIIAHYGSIIFESKEGKGSTFGFILSKSRLAINDKQIAIKQKTDLVVKLKKV